LLLLLAGCSQTDIPTVVAEQGSFVQQIETTGELRAVDSQGVSRPRRGWSRSQIVSMAPEGDVVAEGDFLLQFDTTEAERDVAEMTNGVDESKAALRSQVASAESRMAELDGALKTQEFSFQQAKIRFEQMQYEAEIRRREQQLELRKAELSLADAAGRIESQKIVDDAELQKAQLAVDQKQRELDQALEALDGLTLTAPIGGLVVYKEIWNGGGRSKLKVGDTPWPGMELMEIPDLSRMMVQTRVNEVDIQRVSVGQRVEVRIDALADSVYVGEISRVATLAQREGESEVKSFEVEIHLASSDDRLRPGMTAACSILTARIEDAISVPLDAVFDDEGASIVYLSNSERRVVELGIRNDDRVIVNAGLAAGQAILLRDPSSSLEDVGAEAPPAHVSD
jgi:RND family efflux transporter MFP subunit